MPERLDYDMWQRLWKLHFRSARRRFPTADMRGLQVGVTRAMERKYGPCPPKPGHELPLKTRVALWWINRKLGGLPPVEVPMLLKKVIVSLTFAATAAGVPLKAALADNVITGAEWQTILVPAAIAFWGAFKSNTTVIAPNRKGENFRAEPKE